MARGDGCSKTSVGESATPLIACSLDESSVAASESTPASISGVSGSSAAASPVSSRTIRSTATSTCSCRRAAGSCTSSLASTLSADSVSTTLLSGRVAWLWLARVASSMKRGCDASATLCSMERDSELIASRMLHKAPAGARASARHTAYSSRVMAAMPLKLI